MRILALETTERIATIAVAEGNTIIALRRCDPTLRSTQSLVPAIARGLRMAQWHPRDVELVAVGVGPGSFTGLRVGITTTKVLAYAVGADVLGVDTLEAIAAAAPPGTGPYWTAIDAQRGQWVVRPFFRAGDGWPQPLAPAERVDAESWLAELPAGTTLTGPVLRKAANPLPDYLRPLPESLWSPTARAVALLAARDYAEGRRDDLWTLAPRYSRPSAAEEKLHRGNEGR